MKVLFDHLCFWQKYGGVPRYFVELMKRLPEETYITTVKFSNNEYLKELPNVHCHPFLKAFQFKGKARIERNFGKIFSIPYLLKGEFDIYHQTHYDPYAFKYLPGRIKKVTTIHDMNFYAIPAYYPKNYVFKRQMEASIRQVDRIITISNNSKADICKYLAVPESKISVIYHGIDVNKFSIVEKCTESVEPYILYVGARSQYKNFDRLLAAFELLKRRYPDLKLYCTGDKPTKTEFEDLKKRDLLHLVKFFQPTDNELVALYSNARLFVFPSLYEGFGLPILEAMAAGCPMALSDASCFPEIAGTAAVYFDPYDIDSIAVAVNKVLSDSCYRSELIGNGLRRVADFSWEKCVERHLAVYNSLLM